MQHDLAQALALAWSRAAAAGLNERIDTLKCGAGVARAMFDEMIGSLGALLVQELVTKHWQSETVRQMSRMLQRRKWSSTTLSLTSSRCKKSCAMSKAERRRSAQRSARRGRPWADSSCCSAISDALTAKIGVCIRA